MIGPPQPAPTPVADPAERRAARTLTLAYVLASTAIFLVAGLMGAAMRGSQAHLWSLPDDVFYAVMTAHGLGAFVGWAGFAVMGLSFWVLAEVGFPLGVWGRRLGWWTFWLMIAGVAGVVVTTLFFGFGASWVFLYPLPFHGAGAWGDAVTAVFAASVLVVGLSIIVWCLAMLVIVTGPGLRSTGGGVGNRLLAAMGFGILWPRRFATERPVPYSVIPLTVIAIDMIIATLPLAVLLVAMIVESIAPGVTVDPLLAKNVLWWFGHPVVYLLLFPAVAVYYLLVPRFARRPLVAGNIIVLGWTIAVIANITVWAHHLYLDYPNGIQAAINTTMEPITFALTIVSALSLYSLLFTIFRSRWRWNAATTALFVGLVGWLLSGLSGVVNATIAFDVVVHNTLWVVGHFHHMALLNIGLVIFAAIYAFLPELVGRPLYSDRLGIWHVVLTFIAGTGVSIVWMIQGLEGAPRRFSELPARWDGTNAASIPLVMVLALAQLLFVFNLVQTLRGRTSAATVRERLGVGPPRLTSASLQGFALISTMLVVGGLGVAGWGIGRAAQAPGVSSSFIAVPPSQPGADSGARVFAQAGCGGCHTLKAAGASGTVGPNLDQLAPDAATVRQTVTQGLGAMPSFAGRLSPTDIDAVARYVSTSAAP